MKLSKLNFTQRILLAMVAAIAVSLTEKGFFPVLEAAKPAAAPVAAPQSRSPADIAAALLRCEASRGLGSNSEVGNPGEITGLKCGIICPKRM